MEQQSFKELYDVFIKATYLIEENGFNFEENEVIAHFDKIQVAGLQEVVSHISANGGFDNRGLVFWDTTKQLNLRFSQGVFNNAQFALLHDAKPKLFTTEDAIAVSVMEDYETNENGEIELKNMPVGKVFVYNKETGEKMEYGIIDNIITTSLSYKDVVVNYSYNYMGGGTQLKIGNRLISGFLSLEAKTRVKDDTNGLISTGLIKIPKLKLMSDLSIRLGEQAVPVSANFSAQGIPVGGRGDSYVMEFFFLKNDISSDL